MNSKILVGWLIWRIVISMKIVQDITMTRTNSGVMRLGKIIQMGETEREKCKKSNSATAWPKNVST